MRSWDLAPAGRAPPGIRITGLSGKRPFGVLEVLDHCPLRSRSVNKRLAKHKYAILFQGCSWNSATVSPLGESLSWLTLAFTRLESACSSGERRPRGNNSWFGPWKIEPSPPGQASVQGERWRLEEVGWTYSGSRWEAGSVKD